jgi:hypothetical protein
VPPVEGPINEEQIKENQMRKFIYFVLAMVLATALAAAPVLSDVYYSPHKIDTTGAHTMWWTGQGTTDGELNTVECDDSYTPYLLWIFTIDKGEVDTSLGPTLTLGGTGSGSYSGERHGNEFHFFTPYFKPDSSLTVRVDFYATDTGNGAWGLKISHGCPGGGPGPEERLEVRKTVVTSYTRTHSWSIDKAVTTENEYTEDGFPKIWLYVDGHGDETATWTIDVTYEGYEDSDFNVSGEVTIENTGGPDDLDAVINSVEDLLAGTPIDVDFGVEFPYTLVVGETLTGTYSVDVDGMIEDFNVVTVTTDENEYTAREEIVWGDPTTEVNKTVTVVDVSDLFGEVELGTVTAPNDAQFTYTKNFAWVDYGATGCGDYTYDNTAEVIGDDGVVLGSADATLKVNVQCYIYETAYAKGGSAVCFIPTFNNWGWTNSITPGTYTWPLWAGAGQCDTSKGTLVGTVTVVYSATTHVVTVTYNVAFPYTLEETHVYAGTTKFPQVKQGKKTVDTVAPGQYYNAGPFTNGTVYVIAHAKVGIPDPNFGP